MSHHNAEETGQSITNTKGSVSITPAPGREEESPEEGQLTRVVVIALAADIEH